MENQSKEETIDSPLTQQEILRRTLTGLTFDRVLGDAHSKVTLVDYMGGDLSTTNGARASYGSESQQYTAKDAKLVRRLAADQHQTPFRHTYFTFHVVAPEFVARQWYKHLVGTEYTFKDLPWSEFSQRYKEVPTDKFYAPTQLHTQSKVNHQSSAELHQDFTLSDHLRLGLQKMMDAYKSLISAGVSREESRLILPFATYTEWTWTASLQALVHFCSLRKEAGAQSEIRQFAEVLELLARPVAPDSWAALEQNHPLFLRERIRKLEERLGKVHQ